MKIGIIGTRGIPNHYGGFEQFADNFSTRMAEKGYDVTVYSSHRHPYKELHYKNVRLIHCYDPEHMLGTIGQFIYDLNCILDCRKQNFDVILQLGYTSSTIWSWLYPKEAILVTNMDGLEWSRAKYNRLTQLFLTHAEKWGVRYSDYLIADSKGIQEYIYHKYNIQPVLIPYGADIYESEENCDEILSQFSLLPDEYDLLIARFEPENNIEVVLKAYASAGNKEILLIGNYSNTAFGRRMYNKYHSVKQIHFAGGIYDSKILNVLRYHSNLYIHGHSVGGTNPSLLEAMGCSAVICAHDNKFNRNILGDDAYYFTNSEDLYSLISSGIIKKHEENCVQSNKHKIINSYNWDLITENIESHFKRWKYGEAYHQEALCTV